MTSAEVLFHAGSSQVLSNQRLKPEDMCPVGQARKKWSSENTKKRNAAKKEFNELVRELARFVRKKDKRVVAHKVEEAKLRAEKQQAEELRYVPNLNPPVPDGPDAMCRAQTTQIRQARGNSGQRPKATQIREGIPQTIC